MANASTLDPITADALRDAVRAAQAGDLDGARARAEEAVPGSSDPAPLYAFLGMLAARAGDLAAAAGHLGRAHRARPGDATIACNRIAVLIDLGDREAALAVATPELAFNDSTLRVARYRGFLAQSLDRFAEAAEAYAFVIERAPQDFESWNNLGNARSALGDFDGSIAALEQAIALDPRAAPTHLNLSTALRSAGRRAEAEAVLRSAAESFPEDSHARHDLYVLLKGDGRHEEALPMLEAAVQRDPAHAGMQLKLGIEYGLVMETGKAEQAFLRALDVDPRARDAYLGLAIQYEHTNREEEFAPLIARAEASGADIGTLSFLRALEHRRAKRFEEGLAALALVPPEVEPERTAHLHATLLDRLGRSDEAFQWFEEAATRHAADPSEPLKRAAELRGELRGELAVMTPEWVAGWTGDVPPSHQPAPVFLVGFPRSGTTLLDTILMGHPDVAVLEEKPALNLVDDAIGGLNTLATMDPDAIAAARARYFEEVAKLVPLAPGQLLVDKSPLFLHKVPLIKRLFPEARFILALRHPCDVLLSCFMSNFRLNRAMSNFLRLEDAAALYDLSFSHWERANALFAVEAHPIVYERLIENVEAEIRPLFDWLGLEWHPQAVDHVGTARSRGLITTASYSQVTEPIYKRAVGRWHRYRAHLEPVLPALAPWAEKFGYTL
ncbi:tetratricopeptide repeat-containing sulfotransferase family protein [Sphingomonas psychrotolerans]|uniref:Sulfotransferase n=1 Tax=Sphingomonas psychrotolerans TaxID=1327635 RepID=A0A2K8MIM3_9SPHN|nr:tetratricopeptide repeat-containing sulfotransferase family protein [Sphingomonas psychrotolerans]ATY33738.1 sulfotransferase [Sphingomonas psychrotolerans]